MSFCGKEKGLLAEEFVAGILCGRFGCIKRPKEVQLRPDSAAIISKMLKNSKNILLDVVLGLKRCAFFQTMRLISPKKTKIFKSPSLTV